MDPMHDHCLCLRYSEAYSEYRSTSSKGLPQPAPYLSQAVHSGLPVAASAAHRLILQGHQSGGRPVVRRRLEDEREGESFRRILWNHQRGTLGLGNGHEHFRYTRQGVSHLFKCPMQSFLIKQREHLPIERISNGLMGYPTSASPSSTRSMSVHSSRSSPAARNASRLCYVKGDR